MAEIDAIKNNIIHVRGPQGQTVVLVSPGLRSLAKRRQCRTTCLGMLACLTITAAVLFGVLGIVFGSIFLPQKRWLTNNMRNIEYYTFCFIGATVFLIIISILLCRCIRKWNREDIEMLMHKEGSPRALAYQALERQMEHPRSQSRPISQRYEAHGENPTAIPMYPPSAPMSLPGGPVSTSWGGMSSTNVPYHGHPQGGYLPIPTQQY